MAAKKKVGPGSGKPEGPAVQVDGCQTNAPMLQRQWQYLLDGLRRESPGAASVLAAHGELISVTETEVQIALGDAWRPLLEPRKQLLSELAKGRAIVWVDVVHGPAHEPQWAEGFPEKSQEITGDRNPGYGTGHDEHQGPEFCPQKSEGKNGDLIDRAAQSLAAAFGGTVLQLDPEVAAVLASELHGAAVAVHHGDQEPLLAALRRVCRTEPQGKEVGTLGSERSEEGAGQ